MGKGSAIEWTDHTFNPWWGCVRVSPGCEHCYAETFANRVGQKVWGPAKTTERRLFGDKHWAEPVRWNDAARAAGVRARVFCASMADVFEDHPSLPTERAKLWSLIESTPWLDWQILTKRPENVERMVPASWRPFPLNVWLGVSVEDQQRADERIPYLLGAPAHVRFLSCEPLLGPVDLPSNPNGVHWVIIGGESGPKARPFHVAWARDLIAQSRAIGAAPFVKQMGRQPFGSAMGDEDGLPKWHAPVNWSGHGCGTYEPRLRDAKGGDWTEWPDDLRVREMPYPEPGER